MLSQEDHPGLINIISLFDCPEIHQTPQKFAKLPTHVTLLFHKREHVAMSMGMKALMDRTVHIKFNKVAKSAVQVRSAQSNGIWSSSNERMAQGACKTQYCT